MSILLDHLGGSLVSNVTEVILANIEAQTGIATAFSPSLDYQEVLESVRSASNTSHDGETRYEDNVKRQLAEREASPRLDPKVSSVLAWYRRPISTEKIGELGKTVVIAPDGSILNAVKGSFQLIFNFFTADMRELEIFEVGYASRALISNLRGLEVDLSGVYGSGESLSKDCPIGQQSTKSVMPTYTIIWQEMASIVVNKHDNFYASIEFEASVSGTFLFDSGKNINTGGHGTEGGHHPGYVNDVVIQIQLDGSNNITGISTSKLNEELSSITKIYKNESTNSPPLGSSLDLTNDSPLRDDYNKLLVEALKDYYKHN